MKKTWFCILLIVEILSAYAQTDSTSVQADSLEVQFVQLPDSTAIGTPDGKLVSKEIGPGGGTIVSEDGRIELTFPEGALTSNTIISIQPATNLAPNGTGKAYQFAPSGTQFKIPVQITIHYSDEEAKECHPDLMGMAMQDHTGKWEFTDYIDWDNSGKKLIGEISHFSYVSNVKLLSLKPKRSTLRVESETDLVLWELTSKLKKNKGKKSKNRLAHLALYQTLAWTVNNIPNGDEKVGQITRDNSVRHEGEPQAYTPRRNYKAPRMLREENPVTISLTIGIYGADGEFMETQRTVSCTIELYDQYIIDIEINEPSDLECGAELRDYANFTIKLNSKRIEFPNITNTPLTLTKQADCRGESGGGRLGGDYPLRYDPAGCVGPIHIAFDRLKSHEVKNYPPEVSIEFYPRIVKIMKRMGKYPEEKKESPKGEEEGPTVGNRIRFMADRSPQNFKIGSGSATVSVAILPF